MNTEKFWDGHDPVLVVLGIIFLGILGVAVFGIGLAIYNGQPAWHDTGKVQSVGSSYSWDSSMSSFLLSWNTTFTTQNHGTITLVQDHNCFACPVVPWNSLKVNETIGVIQTHGGLYNIQVLN